MPFDYSSSLTRSKTMPSLMRPKLTRKITNFGKSERLKNAKKLAEKAIKLKKVFTIQGEFSAVRHSLRKRGWVEKFYRNPVAPQKSTKSKHRDEDDDDDDDDNTDIDNDQTKVTPWVENEGIYGIMSRCVRNVNPTFIWVMKRDVIDYRFLTRDQMVNHYCKADSFTTKVGLCVNIHRVPWFEDANPGEFYPRCYRLSHEEEKAAFIDDFRLTACVSILKIVVNLYMEGGECNKKRRGKEGSPDAKETLQPELQPFVCTNQECTRSRRNMETENLCVHEKPKKEEQERKREKTVLSTMPKPSDSSRRKKKRIIVPQKCLDRAIAQCEKYLQFCCHDDIDQTVEPHQLTPAQWDELSNWHYQLAHDGGIIPGVPASILGQVENLLNRIKAVSPQYELDGIKNVWLVKPGAKSRGKGIVCYNRLEEMLKLVDNKVVRQDDKYVVQKYVERPLLIHNCKSDIRQWFLVTDWNPLTLYFYQDSYFRFCSQQFTLDDYDESIHLSNNPIQKHYKNGPRSKSLPEDNMWTHEKFCDYIKSQKQGNLWNEMIYPAMKKAIVCVLLSTQDIVKYRKASFELYGADFILTEDYQPWLMEINSNPSMECSTEVTSRLCANVLEDTMKGVYPLTESTWSRTCNDCGNGMNLHLDNINPFCKCQQDGIKVTTENLEAVSPRSKSARNSPSRASSYYSPRSPSASHCNHIRTGVQPTKQLSTTNGVKKVLLRYTDAGIKRPVNPQTLSGPNGLPKLVRRYIGRRVGQYHELSMSKDSAIFIDTSQLNGALSIMSHGFHSR